MVYLNIYMYKDLYINVQSIFIYNSQKNKNKAGLSIPQACSASYLAGRHRKQLRPGVQSQSEQHNETVSQKKKKKKKGTKAKPKLQIFPLLSVLFWDRVSPRPGWC